MKIDLDRTGFIHLLIGSTPGSDMKEKLEKKGYGYSDDRGSWVWDEDSIHRLSAFELRQIYMEIRQEA